jgi:hypothetical protein
MIEDVVGVCDVYTLKDGEKVRSPGLKYKHYSPNCATASFDFDQIEQAISLYDDCVAMDRKAYFLCDDQTSKLVGGRLCLNLGATEGEIASNLYLKLREGEKVADVIIAIFPQKKDGAMVGVLNRMSKACK